MKKKCFEKKISIYALLVFFFSNFYITFAQNAKLDSLQHVLKTHTKKDTTRVNLLNAIAYEIYGTNLDEELKILNESRLLSDRIDYKKGKAVSLNYTGQAHMYQSNFKESIDNFEKSMVLYKVIGNLKGVSKNLNSIGVAYFQLSNREKSLEYFKKSLQVDKQLKDKNGVSAGLNNIGTLYQSLGEYEKSLEYLKKAILIKQEINDEVGVGRGLYNIGTIYAVRGDYPHAIENYKKALLILEKNNKTQGVSLCLNEIGDIYFRQERFNTALEYFKKSLKINDSKKNNSLVKSLRYIGRIYKENGENVKAIEYFKKALKMSQEIGNKEHISYCLNALGKIHLETKKYTLALQYFKKGLSTNLDVGEGKQFGESVSYIGIGETYYHQKKYKKGLYNLIKGLKLAEKFESVENQKLATELLSKTYYKTQQFKKAYNNQIKFKTLSDSLFNKKKIQKITAIEYEYAYKKRLDSAAQRENNLKNEVTTIDKKLGISEQQKLWWIIGFFCLILLLFFLHRNHRFKQLKAQSENTNLRFQALNMQMNPHFIYNSLSSIQQYVLANDPNSAQQYLAQFSVLMRAILASCKKEIISLDKEIEIIKNYIELEKKRFRNSFDFEIVNSIEDSSEIYLPPLLIQPLVENAVIHGVSTLKERKGFISISFNIINQELECIVNDNGIGIETSTKEKQQRIINHESIAIKNIEERLKLLDTKNTQRLFVSPSNKTPHGTQTRILIPVY